MNNFFLGSKRGGHPPAAGGLGGNTKQREVAFESELPSGEMRNEWNRDGSEGTNDAWRCGIGSWKRDRFCVAGSGGFPA